MRLPSDHKFDTKATVTMTVSALLILFLVASKYGINKAHNQLRDMITAGGNFTCATVDYSTKVTDGEYKVSCDNSSYTYTIFYKDAENFTVTPAP